MRAWVVAIAGILGLAAPAADPAPPRGWNLLPVPLAGFNPDDGLGLGLRILAVDLGDGTVRPYRASLLAQVFRSTHGVSMDRLIVDLPRLGGSGLRLGAQLDSLHERFAPYHGLPGAPPVALLTTCGDREALAADPDRCPDNPLFAGARYAQYQLRTWPRIGLSTRYQLAGGPWQLAGSLRYRHYTVTPTYPRDELGQTRPSRLIEDARAGRLGGYDGSSTQPFALRVAEAQLSVLWDDRDQEASPTRGGMHELAVRTGVPAFGASARYTGATLHLRQHWTVEGDGVLAARLLADVLAGEVPFTELSSIGGADRDLYGLGGVATLRGFPKNRFVGRVKLLGNLERRWTSLRFSVWTQRFVLQTAAGVDVGRAFADLALREPGPIALGTSIGARLTWNDSVTLRLDGSIAVTEPGLAGYFEYAHLF